MSTHEEKPEEKDVPAIMIENELEETTEQTACLEGEEAAAADTEAEGSKKGKPGRFRIPKTPQIKAPKVAGQRVTLERNQKLDFDVVTRDPHNLNLHCRVQFEDIIAEPDETVFSFDTVWTLSYKIFTSTKLWCYRITSLICAIPAAICWGIEFACLSFCTIWCWQPYLRAMDIYLYFVRRIFEIMLSVFWEPCFNAMGKCLSHIIVTLKKEG